MRNYILLYLNGERMEIRGDDAFRTLSDYLRYQRGLTGTKVVCSEGDCGACAVLIGRPNGERLSYLAANSCIQFLYQLDGAHIVSVEGLSTKGELSPVQDAMVRCHGSQCGFCTPGFVVALSGLFETDNGPRTEPLTEDEMRIALSGNLCRCTGYAQIFESGKSIDPAQVQTISKLYPDAEILKDLNATCTEGVQLQTREKGVPTRTLCLPKQLDDAITFKAEHPKATIVAGATDIGVQVNKRVIDPKDVLCLNRLGGLSDIKIENNILHVGPLATWKNVDQAIAERVPQYHEILERFGSPLIRHAATIGGNFINASPISDSAPFHFVTGTRLEMTGPEGKREVPIDKFYLGYKRLDMQTDELLTQIITPLPEENETLRLYKVSRRKHLDISTFTAAILMQIEDGKIKRARIAYGGVGPVVFRLVKTEEFLTGKPLDLEIIQRAGCLAREEITPISDVRGSAEYRLQLGQNILLKFYHEVMESQALGV